MMKKVLLLIIVILTSFSLSGCSLKKAPAALQINTTPVSSVFVDGKQLGKTPYQANNLKEGEVVVKLIPESSDLAMASWEGRVKLSSGVLTLIDREFASTESASSGQILTLEKIRDSKSASLSIISDPDGVLIKINGEAKGFSPLSLDKIAEGDYEILLSKDGYTEKMVKARAALGYKLIVNIKLSQLVQTSSAVTPSATPSAKPTTVAKVTPSQTSEVAKPYVLIKDTPTNFLRVRTEPKTGSEIGRVLPGEKYSLLEEKAGWYKIRFATSKEGWVSGQYSEKFE